MDNWYIFRDGHRHGPYAAAQMKTHAATGHLLPVDLVTKDGMSEPVPAGKLKGLFPTAPVQAASEPPEPHTDEPPPAPRFRTRQPPSKRLILIGAGVVAVALVGVVVVVVALSGKKGGTPKAGESDATSSGAGGRVAEPVVDLPDFSKADYSFDVSKIDYTKGPQGQNLERRQDGERSWQEYPSPDNKSLFHGPAVQTRGGKKIMEVYFFAGAKHGLHTEWADSGQKQFVGVMKDGKKHGKWQHWHDNGKPQKEEFFLDGVKHGLETTWFLNGTKEFESAFVNGKEHGRRTAWWENGQKANEIGFKNGVRHGPATWWSENGKVAMRLSFRDGETHYDPTTGTVEDFATAVGCIFPKGAERRKTLDAAFATFGRPTAGYADVADRRPENQRWVYRCTDSEALLRCTVVRNDLWEKPRVVDIFEARKK
jgi:antitoxin component YwqK of YwqJK toxin-antitoxin module